MIVRYSGYDHGEQRYNGKKYLSISYKIIVRDRYISSGGYSALVLFYDDTYTKRDIEERISCHVDTLRKVYRHYESSDTQRRLKNAFLAYENEFLNDSIEFENRKYAGQNDGIKAHDIYHTLSKEGL